MIFTTRARVTLSESEWNIVFGLPKAHRTMRRCFGSSPAAPAARVFEPSRSGDRLGGDDRPGRVFQMARSPDTTQRAERVT